MRTFGTILATAIITALLTSAAWVFLYNKADREALPPAADVAGAVEPAPSVQTAPMAEADSDETVFTPPATAETDLMTKNLVLPVLGYDIADLTPQFDDRRGNRGHRALDFMAPRGTPVLAIDDGVVVKFFDSERGGITIYQYDPTESWIYYYAHLDARADGIEEGDAVRQGQVIGTVGSTGNAEASAPHLHLAIKRLGDEKNWWEGEPVDPYPAFASQ